MRRRARVVSLILAALGAVGGLALVGLAPQQSGSSPADRADAEPPAVPGSDQSSAGDAGLAETIRATAAAGSTGTSPPSTSATTTSPTFPTSHTGPSLPSVSNVFVAQGEGFSATSGPAQVNKSEADDGATLGYIENGDWVSYSGVDVPDARTFTARVASNTSGGMIEIRERDPFGPLLGVVAVPSTGGWESFTTVSTPMSAGPSGTVVLRFTGDSGYLLDVDTFMISTD